MSLEHVRERKQRYRVLIVPDKTEKTRTFSTSLLGLFGAAVAAILVIVSLVVAAIVYTPIGSTLPTSNQGLEKKYGMQITIVQEQLNALIQEMNILRSYNLRLRQALGERVQDRGNMVQPPMPGDSSTVPDMAGDEIDPGSALPRSARQLRSSAVTGGLPPLSQGENSGLPSMQFPLMMPADGYQTRGFDIRQSHYGIDIAAREGSSVLAAADGKVIFADWTYDDGFCMMIAHSEGYMTVYKHNRSLLKFAGTDVKRGELIALLGNTGKSSSGPHLHFEVWKDGNAENPDTFMIATQ